LAPALSDPATATGELEQRLVTGPSIAELVEYAVQRNPAILATRQAWKAVIEQYRLDTALADPELEGSYAVDAKNTTNLMDWEIGLSQTFPFPGTLSRKGEVSTLNAKLAQLEFGITVRDVAVQVRQSAAELSYIREARRIVAHNQELLEHLVKASISASAQDRGTLLDVVKAQSQAAQLQYDALLMTELETTETARLNAALARPTAAPIGPLTIEPLRPVPYALPALQQLARESLEELRIADAEIEKAQAEIRVARFETYPEIKLGAFFSGTREENSMTPGDYTDKNGVGIQAGISLPFWIGKNQGRLAKAQAEAAKAQATRDAKGHGINAELSTAFFRLKNALRLVTLYEKELLPQATKAMTTAEAWFKDGQGSFSDLVETETVFYNFELALARARADYEKYLARLMQLCGKDLIAAPVAMPEQPSQLKVTP
jgi:outer membrane protein TolC